MVRPDVGFWTSAGRNGVILGVKMPKNMPIYEKIDKMS
jgi:hypothetical protein